MLELLAEFCLFDNQDEFISFYMTITKLFEILNKNNNYKILKYASLYLFMGLTGTELRDLIDRLDDILM